MAEQNDIKTTLTADASGYKQGLDDARRETEAFERSTEGASRAAGGLADSAGRAGPSLENLGDVVGDVGEALNGSTDAALRLAGSLASSGLVIGTTAAALAVLGGAFLLGDAEIARYGKTLALTGNAAGLTAGQLQLMAEQIGEATGTQREAAEALVALAGSGKVAAEQMPAVATAVIAMSDATGESVDRMAQKFADLADEPAKGLLKLNESYNFLTPAVYEHVKALEAQGRKAEAAALAQDEFAKAAKERADDVKKSAGIIERAWDAVGEKVKKAIDFMADIGRASPLATQIAEAEAEVARIRRLGDSGDGFNDYELEKAESKLRALKAEAEAQRKLAEEGRQRAVVMREHVRLEKEREEAAKRANDEAARSAQAYGSLVATLGGLSPQFRKEWDLLTKAFESGRMGAKGSAEAVAQLTAAQAALLERQPAVREATREQEAADREGARALADARKAVKDYLGKLEDKASAAEREVADWGKTQSAIEATSVARLEEARALLVGQPGMEQKLADLEREIAARKRLAAAAGSKEALEAGEKAGQAAAKAQADAAKDAGRFWKDVYDDVGEGLTDAIFEGGKSGWDLLKHTIEATFIRATIQPAVSGAVGSLLGSVGVGPGGGAGSLLGGVGSLGSLGAFGGSFAGALAPGATFAGTMAAAQGSFAAGAYGSAAGYAAGAVAPYALAAYAVLDAMGAFKGATPHRGGAAFREVGGGGGLATAGNTSGFGLDWGAFRAGGGGDRSGAIDTAVSTLIDGVAADVLSRAARYGADASGLRITGRFASDNDDPSVGGFRVSGAGGTVFETSGKFSKDGNKGFEQFSAESLRVQVAALQALDLDGWVGKLVDAVDPAADSLETLTQALNGADEMAGRVALAEQVRALGEADALEAVRQAGLSAAAAYFESGERIRTAAASGAASLGELAELSQRHYQNELALLRDIESASRSTSAMFEDSVRNLRYQVADDPGKYALLDAEAARYMDTLRSLTDPAEIERYAGLLDRTLNTAFGLLSPDEQSRQLDPFIARFGEVGELVQERLAGAQKDVLDKQAAAFKVAGDAAAAEIARVGGEFLAQLQRVGASLPTHITTDPVVVRIEQVPAYYESGN